MQRNRFLVATAATLGAAAALTGPLAAQGLDGRLEASAVVDLTHVMHPGMPYWPGSAPFTMRRIADYPDGYRVHVFEVGENTGTHVDAPAHFIEGGVSIDRIALPELIVPAVVIDVTRRVAEEPDYALTAADVRQWESEHGRIPAGSLVILSTGWHARYGDPDGYVNLDDDGVMHFPGFGPDSAELLVERDVAGIGIDTLSTDHGPSTSFASHRIMLEAGKYQIENLANVDRLPPTGATVVVGVLPVREGTQAQARVIALLRDAD